MSALLDSLTTGFHGDDARGAALAAVRDAGLPDARSEAWKYTSLRALERRTFAPSPDAVAAFDQALLDGIAAPRAVFVNGRFDAAHSDMAVLPAGVTFTALPDLPPSAAFSDADQARRARGDDVFARINDARADAGVSLRIDDGVIVDAPIHLVFVGTQADADLAWHMRHHIELGSAAAVAVVEHQLSGSEHRHLETSASLVQLGARSRLRHVRVQTAASGATGFLRTSAQLAADARYERLDLELGAALSRHELDVRLEGAGAQLVANGVLLADGRRHVDTRLGIEHLARDTVCELLWRGLGAGRGRVVFHGGITIHEGADGSDANLSNKNLLLDANAEIDTQPVLVINADEVKAAHGATVGQLDPTALFYLRSRGLPPDDARRLLMAAFVREPLSTIAFTELPAMLETHLDRALQRLSA